ncbi:serine/threonine-protein kinase [Nocardioides rubriscoriae]|uniref:serine/threonine-protein kinase n=1 Tax=Nocardioides rubriscoriae TaxID=642762 RepID=UPI0011DF9395|nr:serine/threonine-protein kinase [Nocardioides rubriscoriae]
MTATTIAGRYTVERVIGHGGMGSVYLCRDEVLGRRVAVKQVGHLPGESTSDVDRALREARSSAALNHPHVVSVYDAVEDGDHNWLVMEYVESRTLAEVLADEGPLSPERAARLGAQAADGLAAAHSRGTVHRDVKPGNILVTADDHVKIMDFGISRTHGDAQLTSTGLLTGTPAYFAPEIARGEEPGLAADVWALGATLYAAVEGHPPYPEQGNALALLTTIATRSAPLPRRAGVLTEAINRMMDRDPVARWSMADAAHVLRRIQDQAAVEVVAPPPAARTTAITPKTPATSVTPATGDDRRRGWLLPVAAVLLLALLVGAGALLLQGGDDTRDRVPAAGRTDTPRKTRTPAAAQAPETSSEPAPSASVPVAPSPPAETEGESEADSPAPTGDVEAFGEEYYGLLPGDTEAAYALLSPSYGSSYAQYDGFWRTIEAVDVRDVTAVDDTTVDVSLTYTTSDGGTDDETRRLYLEPTDDGYVIVDDTVV